MHSYVDGDFNAFVWTFQNTTISSCKGFEVRVKLGDFLEAAMAILGAPTNCVRPKHLEEKPYGGNMVSETFLRNELHFVCFHEWRICFVVSLHLSLYLSML